MITLRTRALRTVVEANACDATFVKEGSDPWISTDYISACFVLKQVMHWRISCCEQLCRVFWGFASELSNSS